MAKTYFEYADGDILLFRAVIVVSNNKALTESGKTYLLHDETDRFKAELKYYLDSLENNPLKL